MNNIKSSKADKIFNIINFIILTIVLLLVIYPLYFVIIASFSDPNAIYAGLVWIVPRQITFEGYQRLFNYADIWMGYKNSLIYTIVGTTVNLVLTLTSAYALARKDLFGKKIIMIFLTITMFFNGGLIPTYLVVKNLNLIDSMWALILPNAVWVYNIIITRTFFQNTIPDELLEAAEIDGCNNTKYFFKILLPLSKAVIAVMVLFYGVAHWNEFFNALIYLRDKKLYPLQIILRNILIENEAADSMMADADTVSIKQRIGDLIKYGAIIVSSLPVLIIYPFLQKYFVQGVTIGSVKG